MNTQLDCDRLEAQLSSYTKAVAERVLETDFKKLAEIAQTLIQAKFNGGRIFTAGNGGSAATASHMANDLMKGCRVHNREGFRVQCLTDSVPIVTCLANDFSYEEIFSLQLRTFARKGDIYIVFSGSGNSPDIVHSLETAKNMGLYTIGFTGGTGGKLAALCDLTLIAPTGNMEQLEDMHMHYEHALATVIRTELTDLFGMEIIRYPAGRTFSAALFDFDGTVSLIREGWRDIMIPYFTEVLEQTGGGDPSPKESREELAACVAEFVDKLTGKQTIAQCMQLNDEVVKRGGKSVDPLLYKKEYLRRLEGKIHSRKEALGNQSADPEEYLVPGVKDLVRALKQAGIPCYLASGTDEADVLREAGLLGIADLFDGGISGARDETLECSKELVIKRILRESRISGEDLVSFGDGYVEIELVKNIGGYAFGLASDEVRKKGINEWKRRRLLSVGADVIIPDFTGYRRILDFILH